MKATPALFSVLGVTCLLIPHLTAGTTWDGGGGDNEWGTANNWDPDGTPSVGSGVDLTFAGTTRLTSNNNYTAWDDFGSIFFATGAGTFNLTGNAVDLFGKIENNSASTQTISFGEFSFNSSSAELSPIAGNLVINSANIYNNGNTINVLGNNGNTLTINGIISQTGGLTVNQNSNVVLTGANSYSGTTTLTAGTLSIGNGGTTGTLGSGTVTNNAALILNRSNDFTLSNNLSGSGSLSKLGAGVVTLGGTNSFTGKTSISAGTLSIDGDGRLGSAPGSLVADQLTLNGGTLRTTGGSSVSLNTNRGITLGASGGTLDSSTQTNGLNANFNSPITGTGALTLKANGDTSDSGGGVGGNLSLLNSSNNFIGNITIQSGVVNFSDDGAFGNTANDIIIQGGGLVATGNRTLPSTRDVVLSGGGNKIFRAYGSATFTINGAISGSGNVRHTDGGHLILNGVNSFTGNIDNVRGNLTLANSAHTGNIVNTAGTLTLANAAHTGNVVNSAGTLVLNAGNTYTGYTHITNSSTLRLDADNSLPDGSTVLLYGGTTFNANGRTDTLGSLTTGSASDTNVIVNLGSGGNLTITNNNLPAGLTSGYSNATVAGKITGTGNITYNHATSNTALWDWQNGTNDFTGNITITNGRLRTALNGGAGAFGAATNDLIFNGEVAPTLTNGLGTASIQGTASGAINFGVDRSIILNSGKEGTLYVWGGNTYTINGQVTGGGNLRKEDAGILLLNNTSNNYTGLTRIALGTIRVGAAGVIPDASGIEIAGGNLDLNSLTESVASLSGTGGAVNGGGTLTVPTSGSATYSGALQNATTLNMAGTGTQTIAGSADNSNGWASVSSGTLELAKASSATVHAIGRSFAVGLSISGGTARLGGIGNDQIFTETDVTQSGGVFDFNGRNEGFRGLTGSGGTILNGSVSTTGTLAVGEGTLVTDSFTYGGVIENGAGTMALTKTGAGTQVLTGDHTFSGTTQINAGKLVLGSGASMVNTSTITIGASSTLDVSATGGWTLGSSQTLTGSGTLVGNTTISGDLRPGSSPGALSVTGDLGLNLGSDWYVEIGGTDAEDFDRLLVSGQLSAGGNIIVSFFNAFNPALNDSFQIASFGTFADNGYTFNFASATLDSGLTWDTDDFSTTGIITVIPEPSTYLLVSLASLALAVRRRKS